MLGFKMILDFHLANPPETLRRSSSRREVYLLFFVKLRFVPVHCLRNTMQGYTVRATELISVFLKMHFSDCAERHVVVSATLQTERLQ